MPDNTADIIQAAWRQRLAVPAFNIPYLPMMAPVIRAVRDQDSFALIAVARLEWVKFEAQSLAAVRDEFQKWRDDKHVRLHLDHVPVIDEDRQRVDYAAIIREAIALGYQSVMVDGSRLDLEENIRATAEIVKLSRATGIPCEAELGAVLGHEAGPMPPYEELFRSGRGFTRPDEAREFVRATGCAWLSVAIGNIHGAISEATRHRRKIAARLNLEHLERLQRATGIPLVLHGGSGVRREDVLAAMQQGIAKINIATEIRQAYETMLKTSGQVSAAQEAVYARATELIRDYFGLAGLRRRLAVE
ncbi:MAG: class II fructose-bisphosphate aldolase [Lentisphaerae bacterium]|nr:class II fructose-bisphosphate aldolase [Lentisphaerota bacterium]